MSQQRDFKSDAEIVERARSGDRAAFEELAQGYRNLAVTFVRGRVLEAEIEDVVQEVMARAWEKLPTLKDPQAFPAWLKSLALNTCRSHNRRVARREAPTPLDSDRLTSPAPDPLEKVLQWELSIELRNALAALSPENRRPLIMHLWSRYEYSEIAQKLDMPVTTVVGRIHRAKKQLRRLLGVPEPPRQVRRKGRAMVDRKADDWMLIPQIGHADTVLLTAVSPDGSRFVTAGSDTLVVWNMETGLQEMRGTSFGWADVLCFSPDSTRVAVSGHGGRTYVWDVTSGALLANLPMHMRPVLFSEDSSSLWGAIWSPDSAIEEWVESSVIEWDLSRKKITRRIENMPGTPRAMSADARTLVTVAGKPEHSHNVFIRLADTQLIVWELPEGRERFRLSELQGMPVQMAIDPNSRCLAATSRDPGTPNDVLVWSLEDGRLLHTLKGHSGVVTSLAFSPNGDELTIADYEGGVVTWDVVGGRELRRFAKSGRVQAAAYTMDCGQLITSSPNERNMLVFSGGVTIWDALDGSVSRQFGQQVTAASALAFRPDGESFVSVGYTSEVVVWEEERRLFDLSPADFIFSAAYSRDGTQLAVTTDWMIEGEGCEKFGRLVVLDAVSGKKLHELGDDTGGFVYTITFSPDASHAAVCRTDGSIIIWDSEWREQRRITSPDGLLSVRTIAFSPDSRTIAAGHVKVTPQGSVEYGELSTWDVETGELVRRWREDRGGFEWFAFTPDGSQIAVCMASSKRRDESPAEVRLYDIGTGSELKRLIAPGVERVIDMVMSGSGGIIAARAINGVIVLWQVDTGEVIGTISRDAGIGSISLSPDGRTLAAVGNEGVIRFYDFPAVTTGKTDRESVTLVSLPEGAWIAYTPDGFFDCSPGAEGCLLWRKNGEFLRADQRPERRRPGLALSILT